MNASSRSVNRSSPNWAVSHLQALMAADDDLAEQLRIEVGTNGALALRLTKLCRRRVDPDLDAAAHLVAKVRIAGQLLDQLAQRGWPFASRFQPGEHPRRGEQSLDGGGVLDSPRPPPAPAVHADGRR